MAVVARDALPFEYRVANTLREAQLLLPLPSLLYRLARSYTALAIFESELDPANKKAIFASLEVTQREIWQFVHRAFNFVTDTPECANAKKEIQLDTFAQNTTGLGLQSYYEPVHFDFVSVIVELGTPIEICKPCRRRLISQVAVARSSFWETLPGLFGMSDWNTLGQADVDYQANVVNAKP